MNDALPLSKQIALVERKLEGRRALTSHHLQQAADEVHSRVDTGAKWAPLVMVGALGATAFAVGWRHGNGQRHAIRHRALAEPSGRHPIAAAAALVGTITRIALSPQARDLWRAWAARRRKFDHRETAEHYPGQRFESAEFGQMSRNPRG
jgi:hypothetical protein